MWVVGRSVAWSLPREGITGDLGGSLFNFFIILFKDHNMPNLTKEEKCRKTLRGIIDKLGGVPFLCREWHISDATLYNCLTGKYVNNTRKLPSLDHCRIIIKYCKKKGLNITPESLNPKYQGISFD